MHRRSVLAIPALALGSGRAFAADRIKVGMLKPNIVTVIYWIAVKTGAFAKNGLAKWRMSIHAMSRYRSDDRDGSCRDRWLCHQEADRRHDREATIEKWEVQPI
jgi:hypothetical protein